MRNKCYSYIVSHCSYDVQVCQTLFVYVECKILDICKCHTFACVERNPLVVVKRHASPTWCIRTTYVAHLQYIITKACHACTVALIYVICCITAIYMPPHRLICISLCLADLTQLPINCNRLCALWEILCSLVLLSPFFCVHVDHIWM